VFRYAIPSVTENNGLGSTFPAITPSENISCPVLLIYGTGDLNVNSDFSANQVYERMKKNGKGHLCSVLRYPGAGHLIEPPYTLLLLFITCSTSLWPRSVYGMGRRDRGACASGSRCLAKDFSLSETNNFTERPSEE